MEVNYSFYRLPAIDTLEEWYRQTPADFRFVMKASRFITHIKRLRMCAMHGKTFLARAQSLKEKFGAVLVQFPSNFKATEVNLESMEEFLRYASKDRSIAIEFRDQSCFAKPMLEILRKHRAALVISHSSRYPVPDCRHTADFAYYRFHGPKKLFASSYSDRALLGWARQMKLFLAEKHDVYAFFNNDSGGYAPKNARVLAGKVMNSARRRSQIL